MSIGESLVVRGLVGRLVDRLVGGLVVGLVLGSVVVVVEVLAVAVMGIAPLDLISIKNILLRTQLEGFCVTNPTLALKVWSFWLRYSSLKWCGSTPLR